MKRTNYPFNKLTSEEWQQGAEKGLINAKELLSASSLCCTHHIHASGNSLLIVSIEEAIKALVLRVRAVTGKEPIKKFDQLFFKHDVKHEQAIQQIAYHIIKQFYDQIDKTKKENIIGFNIAIVFFVGLFAYAHINDTTDAKNIFDLESKRKAGLYLDLDKVNKTWLVPQDIINANQFGDYVKVAQHLFKYIESSYFQPGTEENVKELLSVMKEMNS